VSNNSLVLKWFEFANSSRPYNPFGLSIVEIIVRYAYRLALRRKSISRKQWSLVIDNNVIATHVTGLVFPALLQSGAVS